MTVSDIIKALESCARDDCKECPMQFGVLCKIQVAAEAITLIKHQQDEIEMLKAGLDSFIYHQKECEMEVVRDFVKQLESKLPPRDSDCCVWEYQNVLYHIDRIMKEMEAQKTMHKNDAVEQAYNNGFCKGRRYGVCEFCGYLIANADESGVIHYDKIAEHARDYLDMLEEKEGAKNDLSRPS